MWFTDRIFSLVWDISDFFYDAFLEVDSWVWPFFHLGLPLYWIYRRFYNLLTPVAQMGDWLYDLQQSIAGFLDQSGVLSLLSSWINQAEWSWSWVSDAWWNVWQIINAWWDEKKLVVESWIDEAVRTTLAQIEAVGATLTQFRAVWDDFVSVTLPSLVSSIVNLSAIWETFAVSILPNLADWTGVRTLIDSTLTTWFPFRDELVQLWGDIREFFSDPEDYLVRKIESMLERFW